MGVDHLSVEGIPAVRLIVLGVDNRSILALGNGVIEHVVKQWRIYFGQTPLVMDFLHLPVRTRKQSQINHSQCFLPAYGR